MVKGNKHFRICRRYNPSIGTWYVLQKKILFWWHTYNVTFETLDRANEFLHYAGLKSESICETPLECVDGKFVDPCFNTKHYTYLVKLK